MPSTLDRLVVELHGEIREFEQDMRRAEGVSDRTARSIEQRFDRVGRSLRGVGVGLTAGLTAPLTALAALSLKAASDAEETASKYRAVFSSIGSDAERAARRLANSYGLSDRAAQDLLGTTGDLLTGFGFAQSEALGLSQQVNELAVDLASFTNFSGGAEGASRALTSALLGEREAVKSLGISILEADVQAQILENTQNGLTFATERQAKAYATLQIAQRQSKNAIGDFARTQESAANQMRILNAELENARVALGKGLLPLFTPLVSKASEAVEAFADMTESQRTAILVAGGFATASGPVLIVLGQLAIAIPRVTKAFGAMRLAALPLLGPAGILIGAGALIGGVAASMAFKPDSLANAAENVDDAFNTLGSSGGTIDGFMSALDTLGENLTGSARSAWDTYVEGVKNARDEIEDTEKAALQAAQRFARLEVESASGGLLRDLREQLGFDESAALRQDIATAEGPLAVTDAINAALVALAEAGAPRDVQLAGVDALDAARKWLNAARLLEEAAQSTQRGSGNDGSANPGGAANTPAGTPSDPISVLIPEPDVRALVPDARSIVPEGDFTLGQRPGPQLSGSAGGLRDIPRPDVHALVAEALDIPVPIARALVGDLINIPVPNVRGSAGQARPIPIPGAFAQLPEPVQVGGQRIPEGGGQVVPVIQPYAIVTDARDIPIPEVRAFLEGGFSSRLALGDRLGDLALDLTRRRDRDRGVGAGGILESGGLRQAIEEQTAAAEYAAELERQAAEAFTQSVVGAGFNFANVIARSIQQGDPAGAVSGGAGILGSLIGAIPGGGLASAIIGGIGSLIGTIAGAVGERDELARDRAPLFGEFQPERPPSAFGLSVGTSTASPAVSTVILDAANLYESSAITFAQAVAEFHDLARMPRDAGLARALSL